MYWPWVYYGKGWVPYTDPYVRTLLEAVQYLQAGCLIHEVEFDPTRFVWKPPIKARRKALREAGSLGIR